MTVVMPKATSINSVFGNQEVVTLCPAADYRHMLFMIKAEIKT